MLNRHVKTGSVKRLPNYSPGMFMSLSNQCVDGRWRSRNPEKLCWKIFDNNGTPIYFHVKSDLYKSSKLLWFENKVKTKQETLWNISQEMRRNQSSSIWPWGFGNDPVLVLLAPSGRSISWLVVLLFAKHLAFTFIRPGAMTTEILVPLTGLGCSLLRIELLMVILISNVYHCFWQTGARECS